MGSHAATLSQTFTDFDGFRTQIRDVDLEIVPLRGGDFFGKTDVLLGENLTFTHGLFVSDQRYRGLSHKQDVLLGMHFGERGRARFGTRDAIQGDLSILQPGREHFGTMSGEFEYAALAISHAELASLGIDGAVGSDAVFERDDHLRAPPALSATAYSALATLTQIAFDPAVTLTPSRMELLKRALLYPFLLVAAHGESRLHSDTLPSGNIVGRAENWLDQAAPEKLSIIDLCQALGQPLRTVQREFHRTLGMGPAHYLTYYRLQKVRKVLIACDPFQCRVTDVALDHGFWELGRFAGLYKRTYGELPSETLRRRRH